MFYDFRIVAGACGGQWREAPELHKRAPGRRGAKSDKFIIRKALFLSAPKQLCKIEKSRSWEANC